MAGKITDYPSMTTLASGDLMDVSDSDGVGGFTSKSLDWDDLKTNIEGQITFANIYSNDGTIGTGRTATLTDSLSFLSGQVIAAAAASGYASLNIPSGVDPSSPVDGDLWFNGTNLYFRDGATSIDLLGGGADGNGIYDGSGSLIAATTVTMAANDFILDGNTNNLTGIKVKNINTGSGAYASISFQSNAGALSSFIGQNSTANAAYGGAGSLNIGTVVPRPFSVVTGAVSRMFVNSTGEVGIVSASANGADLALGGTIGEKFYLLDSANPYGFGIQSNLLQSFVPVGASQAWGSGTSASFTERMRINSTGLGIGTAAPTEKLEVVGNVKISSDLQVAKQAFIGIADTGQSVAFDFKNVEPRVYMMRWANNAGTILFNMRDNGNASFGTTTDLGYTLGVQGNSEFDGHVLVENVTAPVSSVADTFNMYANDIVAGNSAPHFRNENGNIIKLYQTNTYTKNATSVEDRTLLASASATTLNNNNVLAALIDDLKSIGIIG